MTGREPCIVMISTRAGSLPGLQRSPALSGAGAVWLKMMDWDMDSFIWAVLPLSDTVVEWETLPGDSKQMGYVRNHGLRRHPGTCCWPEPGCWWCMGMQGLCTMGQKDGKSRWLLPNWIWDLQQGWAFGMEEWATWQRGAMGWKDL